MPNHVHSIITITNPNSDGVTDETNYYEHIIRNDIEYKRIYEYIINNPKCWQYDMDNPTKIKTRYQVKLIRNVKQQRD